MTTETAPTSTTILRWQPGHGQQTAALRAAGLKVQDLRDAGFVWAKSQAWEAPVSDAAAAIVNRLTNGTLPPAPVHDEAAVVGETLPVEMSNETFDRQPLPARIPAVKVTKVGVPTHRVQAIKVRLEKRLPNLERDRESNTPKRMAQTMHARREAGHIRRALVIVDAWLAAPVLPVPTEAQLMEAASQEPTHISNGYHGYAVDSGTPRKTDCAVALGLRALAAKSGAAAPVVGPDIAVMEAQTKFQMIPGFFPTPDELVQKMIEAADLCAGDVVLEPSAGKGDIAVAVKCAGADVECVEVVPQLAEILKAKGLNVLCTDFLTQTPGAYDFDAVLMNPPFEKGADIDHVRHAYGFVKPGGKLVAIVSAGALYRQDRKATEFRAWLDELGAEISDNGQAFEKAFKRTGVQTSLVVITKAEG